MNPTQARTIPELLRERTLDAPEQTAFVHLADGEAREEAISRRDLLAGAAGIGERLGASAAGERALLLYPSGLEFIKAFLGCLMAGTIAVPTFPPRFRASPPEGSAGEKTRDHNLERLRGIIRDAEPSLLLCPRSLAPGLEANRAEFPGIEIIVTDEIAPGDWTTPGREITADTIAFLQYTSGSTGAPRGVRITQGNLMANEAMIQRTFGTPDEMLVVGWLPLNHDMGLIGQILQPLYNGGRCIFMSPMHFLQQPFRWLDAISRFGANTSPAPNFAYEHCLDRVTDEQIARLDLSTWIRALSGAEPVRHRTLERFAERFAPTGFRREAFYPCYGLAEATLVVSGSKLQPTPRVLPVENSEEGLTGCGGVDPELELILVNSEDEPMAREGDVGEIWLRGASIAPGYWNTGAGDGVFEGRTKAGEGPYLRTGDLGFLRDGELFITGRIKDLLIIDGRNLYPQDIEGLIMEQYPACKAAAAFALERDGEEQIGTAIELRRGHGADLRELGDALRSELSRVFGASVGALVFLRPGSLPRTSSGKLRRARTRELFLAGELAVLETTS